MVERFAQDWEHAPAEMITRKDGPWVLYPDYAVLESKLAAQARLLAKVQAALAEWDRVARLLPLKAAQLRGVLREALEEITEKETQ